MRFNRRWLILAALLLVTVGSTFLSARPTYALDPGGVFTQLDMRKTCMIPYNTPLQKVGTAVPDFSSPFSSTRIVVWTCGNSIQVYKNHAEQYCRDNGYRGFAEVTQELRRFWFFKYTVRVGFRCTR